MGSLRERNPSLWVADVEPTAFPRLAMDVTVDVAVVGGGITGLTTAARLADEGATVLLVEAGRVASGVTAYTTAKITSLHRLIYADLARRFDEDRARVYGEANEAAISEIARLVEAHGLECDFERQAAYTYTEQDEMASDIEQEVEVAQRVGLPATFTTDVDLPYPVKAAVRFEGQAQFHPRRFCVGLAHALVAGGVTIVEQTRALHVDEGEPCVLTTEGATVRAGHVVLATHLPFSDRGAYFAKAHPHRSYALAIDVNGAAPEGMYISAEEPTRSVRRTADGRVIVGGEGHKTGQDDDTTARYTALEDWAHARFSPKAVTHRWSAQDYESVDHLPYIGRQTSRSSRVWVATGYRKWGMTNGTVAGMILADLVLGRDNPWAPAFDSTRRDVVASARDFVSENVNVARRLVGDRLASRLRRTSADDLAPGEGDVVSSKEGKVAAFRDDDGTLHAVSPTCTHLGCEVRFNTAERTWDCPCHGSRFGVDGRVIQGPAVKDLEPRS